MSEPRILYNFGLDMELSPESILKAIKAIRTKQGLTQEQVAEKIPKSLPQFKRIELGYTELTVPDLFLIAKALNVTVIEIIVEASSVSVFNPDIKSVIENAISELNRIKNEL